VTVHSQVAPALWGVLHDRHHSRHPLATRTAMDGTVVGKHSWLRQPMLKPLLSGSEEG
jgi:hypothetical protein